MSKYTTLVTVTFMRFPNNQAIDQMVDGLPAWPHLPDLPKTAIS
jgi:hypothetical protein